MTAAEDLKSNIVTIPKVFGDCYRCRHLTLRDSIDDRGINVAIGLERNTQQVFNWHSDMRHNLRPNRRI